MKDRLSSKISFGLAIFIVIAIVTTLLGGLSLYFLPEHFFHDALLIVGDPYGEIGWKGSYPLSMTFYKLTGLRNLNFSIVALIQLPIILFTLYKLGIPESFGKPYLRNTVMFIGILMLAFFISYPSKEFINILYLYLISVVLVSKRTLFFKILVSSLLLVVFAAFFRPYYLIIPLIAISLYIFSFIKFQNKVVSILFSSIIVACFISLSYGALKGEFMSEGSRQKHNKYRLSIGEENADTMILSPVDSSTAIGETFGIFYGFFTVNLPFNGIKFFYKPQLIAFLIWQFSLSVLLLVYYKRVLKNKTLSHEQWIFHLVFAYFIAQGIFEPDLGSAIRHKIGILPWIWLAVYYDKGLIKKPARKLKLKFGNAV
jgi:hypothetical protein